MINWPAQLCHNQFTYCLNSSKSTKQPKVLCDCTCQPHFEHAAREELTFKRQRDLLERSRKLETKVVVHTLILPANASSWCLLVQIWALSWEDPHACSLISHMSCHTFCKLKFILPIHFSTVQPLTFHEVPDSELIQRPRKKKVSIICWIVSSDLVLFTHSRTR